VTFVEQQEGMVLPLQGAVHMGREEGDDAV